MKPLILIASVVVLTSAFAAPKPSHRFVFEFPESTGSIQKMQVDLVEDNGKWFAPIKTLGFNGSKKSGKLRCKKVTSDDFDCRRDDHGGGFAIVLVPKPKLTVDYFTADGEADDTPSFMVRAAQRDQPVAIEGVKAAISSKDAF